MPPSSSLVNPDIELPGPWEHRYVSANGARFHVCESRPQEQPGSVRPAAPLVLLLHGFPEFWWAWRHQLPALAAAGYHAVAMDLRGYGTSDKTPRGYDPLTLANDVTGVIRSMGSRSAVVVGHGWGGYVGWAAAAQRPDCVSALCVVGAPHPRVLTSARRWLRPSAAVRHLLAMQVPWLPERRIGRGQYVAQHLAAWAAPGGGFPSGDEAARYRAAFALWPSPHCALEYHRWLFRSRLRSDGRAFAKVLRRKVAVPVAHISGAEDPAEPTGAASASARHVTGPFVHHAVPGSGHFPHEEQPHEFTRLLVGWLSGGAVLRGH
ncbi:MAG: alpha/beta hydrolase [Nocardioidaceae bacterium]